MAPALSDSVLHVGGSAALAAYVGSSLVWQPEGGIVLPDIGAEFQGGYFAGLISHTADGVATHALVVAPRSTGATGTGYALTSNLAWKPAQNSTSGTGSSFDGAANTSAMVAAGIAAHPAAQFCVGLTIGGYNDWYLPSRFELDIAYHHLKPTTTSNNTGWGINAYSVPPRTSNRTAGSPGQTSVVAFRAGGGQDFVADVHWSSTENNSSSAWALFFGNGNNLQYAKSQSYRVRAFRRVAL